MIDVNDIIKKAVLQRAMRLQHGRVYSLTGGKPFILAGGALSGDTVHDFDVYPLRTNPFTRAEIEAAITEKKPAGVSVVSTTKNAITVLLDGGQLVQFCSYFKPSLTALVTSFDYSHVQVGVLFPGNNELPRVDTVFYTDAFVMANVTRCTEYTGSEYPTSSLIRTLKYHKRGKLPKMAAGKTVLRILAGVINRGFSDYADFKDQLDAIDLGLPDCEEACLLWEAVKNANLVRDQR